MLAGLIERLTYQNVENGYSVVRVKARGHRELIVMKGVSQCAVLTIALAALAQPALARTYLNCSTRKVVIISAPSGNTSSAREDDLGFWVDDEAKTLTFLDNTPLTVTRIDRFWISADRDGIFYEFDRRGVTLTYASATTKDGVSTTIVGSGRCEAPPTQVR